ncbi:uncharacterized protein LOC142356538, partial [Convolutriloba macropyga]|uniref:uncharacterized protein LOC142356538 n=1 Tax=Convolutriloba macropyga TaxID=536237 RepID=UPI003F5227EE
MSAGLWSFCRTVPDHLNLLLAIDRFVAVKHAVWYSHKCTRKVAWIAVIPILVPFGVISAYRATTAEVQSSFRGSICNTGSEVSLMVERIVLYAGVPSTVAVVVFTFVLIGELRKRNQAKKKATNNQGDVARATGASKESNA